MEEVRGDDGEKRLVRAALKGPNSFLGFFSPLLSLSPPMVGEVSLVCDGFAVSKLNGMVGFNGAIERESRWEKEKERQ